MVANILSHVGTKACGWFVVVVLIGMLQRDASRVTVQLDRVIDWQNKHMIAEARSRVETKTAQVRIMDRLAAYQKSSWNRSDDEKWALQLKVKNPAITIPLHGLSAGRNN